MAFCFLHAIFFKSPQTTLRLIFPLRLDLVHLSSHSKGTVRMKITLKTSFLFPSSSPQSSGTDHLTLTRALPSEAAEKSYFPFTFIMGHHNVWSLLVGMLEALCFPCPPPILAEAGAPQLPIYFASLQSHALRRDRNYRQLTARWERVYERLGDNY